MVHRVLYDTVAALGIGPGDLVLDIGGRDARHSVALAESAMDADAQRLAGAVLLCAEVSHLKAVMAVRREIIDAGFTPSAQIPGPGDLASAESELMIHQL